MTDTIKQPVGNRNDTEQWMRLARGAAITLVVWAILLHLTTRTIIPPVLVIGLVFAGFIPFLRGERRRLGVGLAIFTTVALAGNLPGVIDELTHLDSAPAFVLTLLSVVAAFVAVIAGLGVFFGWAVAPIRPLVLAAAAVFTALSASSVMMSASTGSDALAAGDVEIVAEKIAFGPNDISMSAGDGGVWIENKDGIRHTFAIEGHGIELEIPALKARRIDLRLAAGSYAFICTVPGHENMTGTLTVE